MKKKEREGERRKVKTNDRFVGHLELLLLFFTLLTGCFNGAVPGVFL